MMMMMRRKTRKRALFLFIHYECTVRQSVNINQFTDIVERKVVISKMDFLLHEIELLREDVDKVERRISALEDSNNFHPHDIRYTRLLDEKKLLVENLCKLRVNISSVGTLSSTTSSINVKSESSVAKRPLDNGRFSNDIIVVF